MTFDEEIRQIALDYQRRSSEESARPSTSQTKSELRGLTKAAEAFVDAWTKCSPQSRASLSAALYGRGFPGQGFVEDTIRSVDTVQIAGVQAHIDTPKQWFESSRRMAADHLQDLFERHNVKFTAYATGDYVKVSEAVDSLRKIIEANGEQVSDDAVRKLIEDTKKPMTERLKAAKPKLKLGKQSARK